MIKRNMICYILYLLLYYMQEPTPPLNLMPKVSRTPFYFSVSLLFLVIWLSIGFFFYNIFLEQSIEGQKIILSETRKSIDDISRDRKVIITRIEESGTIRPSIDLKGIVDAFYEAATSSNVRLKGFGIVNDVISTSLISTEPYGIAHPDAAWTIIEMMRKYAQGKGGRFSLEPITSISGDLKSRTTSVQFKVVSNPIK